jgi:hypothetical protein
MLLVQITMVEELKFMVAMLVEQEEAATLTSFPAKVTLQTARLDT